MTVVETYLAAVAGRVEAAHELTVAAAAADEAASNSAVRDQAPVVGPHGALAAVPAMFFDDRFSVAQTDAFLAAVGEPRAGKARSSAVLEHEKLAYYVDMVETELTKAIALKSRSFFSTLSTIRELAALVEACNTKVALVRSVLGDASAQLRGSSLEVGALREQKLRAADLQTRLELLGEVQAAPELIEAALADGDYVAAQDFIESTRAVLGKELKGVRAVATMRFALDGYAAQLEDALGNEFALLLRKTLVAASSVSLPLSAGSDTEAQTRGVRVVLLSASRVGALARLPVVWRDELSAVLKMLVRSTVESRVTAVVDAMGDRPDFDASASILVHLKALDAPDYVSVLDGVFEVALNALRAAHGLVNVVDGMAAELGAERLVEEMQTSLADGAELVHSRAAKLLAVRAQTNAKLDFQRFVVLIQTVVSFIVASEVVVGRNCYGLRGPLLSQAKVFLSTLHDAKMTKLSILLENELWSRVDVPVHISHLVSSHDHKGTASDNDVAALDKLTLPACGVTYPTPCAYHLTSSSVLLFDMMQDYVSCVERLPALAPDAVSRLGLLLKHFNSRSCQLVLGAGAMHTAGLKAITAAHLAVAAQSLRALAHFLPILCERLAQLLTQKQAAVLGVLTEARQALLDHADEINAKIVAIMTDRFYFFMQGVQGAYDEAFSGAAGRANTGEISAPMAYMRKMVKSIVVLRKVLAPLLPPDELADIYSKLLDALERLVVKGAAALGTDTPRAREQLRVDIAFLLAKVDALPEGRFSGTLATFYQRQLVRRS
ncbi:vacuolar protein sorting-associated protein 54 [Thecamonas trahens ATCC 50062]|uniref:Vacuolar protein sorting-associated protein 54 n=1 Tax=Thecamonas trahens ATCC 50062 TaxID=461836 RepID=A0A0L0D2K3_THETB|nr:vacuolar protein sorting-associated protein 54 [Thecamonas trahens ATCC 50062]KNC46395.1 vacuolar protein sorting-associated protein 54 [Thecamonas trahens ATCC 50062]|eukprot:XP_013760688.1 vacuolar protein sorting-associated protein 54 [Thecamonas trahens ATCC 50062]